MHELSIAQSLLDIVTQEAARHGVDKVRRVGVVLGEFTHVVPHALKFCFDLAKEGTVCDQAELVIETAPLEGRCGECGHEFTMEGPTQDCPECGFAGVEMIGGRELQVAYIETYEPGEAPAPPATE